MVWGLNMVDERPWLPQVPLTKLPKRLWLVARLWLLAVKHYSSWVDDARLFWYVDIYIDICWHETDSSIVTNRSCSTMYMWPILYVEDSCRFHAESSEKMLAVTGATNRFLAQNTGPGFVYFMWHVGIARGQEWHQGRGEWQDSRGEGEDGLEMVPLHWNLRRGSQHVTTDFHDFLGICPWNPIKSIQK